MRRPSGPYFLETRENGTVRVRFRVLPGPSDFRACFRLATLRAKPAKSI